MAAWTSLYSGSATIGTTEYSMTLSSTAGVPAAKTDKVTLQAIIDCSAVTITETFLVQLYDKCRAGDTQRVVDSWVIYGGMTKPQFVLPAVMVGEGWDLTIKKTAGTDRAIGYELRAYS